MATRTTRSRKTTKRSTAAKSDRPTPAAAARTGADATAEAGPAIEAAAAPAAVPPGAEPVHPVKVLGKRELIDRVVATSGIKKKAVKPVIEAMLKELGDALSREETLNLQPFGKASVKRSKDMPNAEVLELRLRRSKAAVAAAGDGSDSDRDDRSDVAPGGGTDPLANAAE